MARPCTICEHPQRAEIDHALVRGESYRNAAVRFGISAPALFRHRATHLPELLAAARERAGQHASEEETLGAELLAIQQERQAAGHSLMLDLMEDLQLIFQRVNLLFEACDRWLRDPDDPS